MGTCDTREARRSAVGAKKLNAAPQPYPVHPRVSVSAGEEVVFQRHRGAKLARPPLDRDAGRSPPQLLRSRQLRSTLGAGPTAREGMTPNQQRSRASCCTVRWRLARIARDDPKACCAVGRVAVGRERLDLVGVALYRALFDVHRSNSRRFCLRPQLRATRAVHVGRQTRRDSAARSSLGRQTR
jgi:hypothetical protein